MKVGGDENGEDEKLFNLCVALAVAVAEGEIVDSFVCVTGGEIGKEKSFVSARVGEKTPFLDES